MNLKYYLRGLGIGIILTTVILSIVNKNKTLSDQEIIEKATKLGMVMKEDEADDLYELLENAKSSTDADTKEDIKNQDSEVLDDVVDNKENESNTGNTDNTNSSGNSDIIDNNNGNENEIPSNDESTDKIVNSENDVDTSQDVITFSIEKGMSSEEVANILEEIGLIKDAKDFNSYVTKEGKAKVIRIGTYTLSVNATYNDIIKTITKEKMSN